MKCDFFFLRLLFALLLERERIQKKDEEKKFQIEDDSDGEEFCFFFFPQYIHLRRRIEKNYLKIGQ